MKYLIDSTVMTATAAMFMLTPDKSINLYYGDAAPPADSEALKMMSAFLVCYGSLLLGLAGFICLGHGGVDIRLSAASMHGMFAAAIAALYAMGYMEATGMYLPAMAFWFVYHVGYTLCLLSTSSPKA